MVWHKAYFDIVDSLGVTYECADGQTARETGWLEFAGLENDGVEQEQTYILHSMKNFNVYDM